jgi:hypothetical protein
MLAEQLDAATSITVVGKARAETSSPRSPQSSGVLRAMTGTTQPPRRPSDVAAVRMSSDPTGLAKSAQCPQESCHWQ